MITNESQLDAIIAQSGEDLKGARRALRQIAPTLPDTAEAQTALGLAYLALEQSRDAMRAFKRATELDPNDPLPRYHLGSLQTDMGLLPQAEENLRQAVAAEPENADYQAALGFVYYKANKAELARAALEKAAEAGSENGDVFASLGYLYYFEDRFEASRDAFARAIVLKPDFAEAYNNRGYLNLALGDLPGAQSDLEACLAIQADYLRARYNLALAAWLGGDQERSAELYRLARRQDKNDAELKQHLEDFEQIAARYPDHNLSDLKVTLAMAQKASRR